MGARQSPQSRLNEFVGWRVSDRLHAVGSSAMRFRAASIADAPDVAALHADSWRRYYRGAYADAFLDGDVGADRETVWSKRLAFPDPAVLTRATQATIGRGTNGALYLWVLDQNSAAQAFYTALGGLAAERALVQPPGGVPGRLHGSPMKVRFVWPDAHEMLHA